MAEDFSLDLDDIEETSKETSKETPKETPETKETSQETNALSKNNKLDIGLLLDFSDEELSGMKEDLEQNTNRSELKIPRLAIVQDKTPAYEEEKEKAENDTDFKPTYRLGSIFETESGKVVSRKIEAPWLKGIEDSPQRVETALFSPTFKLPTQYIKWKDRNTEGRGWHFCVLNKKDPRVVEGVWPNSGGTWGTKEGQEGAPPVSEIINYIGNVYDPETYETLQTNVIVSFQKTNFKTGAELRKYISQNIQRRIRFFDYAFFLYTQTEKNKAGQTFKVYKIARGVNLIELLRERNIPSSTVEAMKEALKIYKMFSDPENGHELQVEYLNASEFDDSESYEDRSYEDSNNEEPSF